MDGKNNIKISLEAHYILANFLFDENGVRAN